MAKSRLLTFTLLVVEDLEKMAAFSGEVYELEQITRMPDGIGPDPIEEIILGTAAPLAPGARIVLKYFDKARPHNGEVILGFTTRDLTALRGTACAPRAGACTPTPATCRT